MLNRLLITVMLIIIVTPSFAWNNDATISTMQSGGRSAAIAKNSTTIYAAVSPAAVDPSNSVFIYKSTDGGSTWSPAGGGGPGNASPAYIRTLKTVSDSVYCMYLVNNIVYMLNMETGTLRNFSNISVSNFDAAASTTYEAIYLYTITTGTTSMRRFSTTDGGLSWSGNISVASGYQPKVCMHNGQLVLNYYGPVLADTATSKIRGVTYTEDTAGVLSPGIFLDLATNTAADKNWFQSVIYSGKVWFFYTQTNVSEDILCMVSSNGGTSYNPPFSIATTADDEYTFDATYSDNGSGRCDVMLLRNGITGTSVEYLNAQWTVPGTFASPQTVNDAAVTTAMSYVADAPSIVRLPGTANVGVFWTGTQNGVTGQFYDSNAPVGINENTISEFEVYPNPVTDVINIRSNRLAKLTAVQLYNAEGKVVISKQITVNEPNEQITVTGFAKGIYTLLFNSETTIATRRIVIN